MFVLENFKNIPRSPRSPYGGRQGSNVIFFQICNKVPGVKKGRGLSPTPGATGACRPLGGATGPPPFFIVSFYKT